MTKTFSTSNKQFKELVQQHIIERLDDDETSDIKVQLIRLVDDFKRWHIPYHQRQYPNIQEAFKQYLLCLPGTLHAEYTYYRYNEVLKEWYEACDQTYQEPRDSRTQSKEDKEQRLYYALIYRELRTLCKLHGVRLP